jgi:hypothetical protein
MNLSTVITSIRAAFIEAVPTIPVYLQLAPQEAQVPYAVMRVSSIDPGEGDTAEKDYSATVAFAVITSSDTDCLASLDSISAKFDRGRIDDLYSSLLNAASFDIQYTEQAAMWVAESSFSVRWTVRA